jgi:hypothetical protein
MVEHQKSRSLIDFALKGFTTGAVLGAVFGQLIAKGEMGRPGSMGFWGLVFGMIGLVTGLAYGWLKSDRKLATKNQPQTENQS